MRRRPPADNPDMSQPILCVAVPTPLYRSFDYLPPYDAAHATLQPGQRVRVPFGRRVTSSVCCWRYVTQLGHRRSRNSSARRPCWTVHPSSVRTSLPWRRGPALLPVSRRRGTRRGAACTVAARPVTRADTVRGGWRLTAGGQAVDPATLRACAAPGRGHCGAARLPGRTRARRARCDGRCLAGTGRQGLDRILHPTAGAERCRHGAGTRSCAQSRATARRRQHARAARQLSALAAGGCHRQRQDRGIPAPHRTVHGATAPGPAAGAGDRTDPAAGDALSAAFRRYRLRCCTPA